MNDARRRKLYWLAAFALVVIAAVLVRAGFHVTKAADASKGAAPPVPVVTASVAEENIPLYLSGIGTVTPLYAVIIKARVDGQLEKVMFTEGQDVAAGAVLAQIDPRPYQAALELAQAQKARDSAQLKNSMIDLERYNTLWKQDSIPQQTLSTQQAAVEQLKATVQADQAMIDTAKVQLDYTTIRSPINGRVGVRLIDPGNIVRAADSTGIVGVNQIDPITVLFTLPEDRFQEVNAAMRAYGRKPLEVRAFGREDGALLGTGTLTLVNNQIDTTTGTVQLKAQFQNAAHKLWPGQYVNVNLVLGVRERAVTVPASTVQRGPNGLYAYVVTPEETVTMQPIRVAKTQDGKAIIEDGLLPGARVVTDGQFKLKPGAKIVEAKAAAAPSKSPRDPAAPAKAAPDGPPAGKTGKKADSR